MKIDGRSLELADKIIKSGGVVGMPTETVYGLGANAFDTGAVEKIFRIKGRPNDNPLIVHIHKDYDISTLVSDVPDYAAALQKAFLPGPLTMVYKAAASFQNRFPAGWTRLQSASPRTKALKNF